MGWRPGSHAGGLAAGIDLTGACGVLVVPDVLANAGGVVVSYFEWVQDLQRFFWNEDEVRRGLERSMVESFARVWEFSLF